MVKKEFFGLLLLVSIISTIALAGHVWSVSGPSVSVYPSTGVTLSSDYFVTVTGSGWTAKKSVLVYWDAQDSDHLVANVTTSGTGTFRVDQLEIEGMSVGSHTVIAVQLANQATAKFTVSATTPPDDRIYSSIQQLESDLGDKLSLFDGWKDYYDLQNGTYSIVVASDYSFQVKAVYVDIYQQTDDIEAQYSHGGHGYVTYENITYFSDYDGNFSIAACPYSPSPSFTPVEVLSGMKVNLYPAAQSYGAIVIAVNVTGITDTAPPYDVYLETVIETAQAASPFTGFFNSAVPPDVTIHGQQVHLP